MTACSHKHRRDGPLCPVSRDAGDDAFARRVASFKTGRIVRNEVRVVRCELVVIVYRPPYCSTPPGPTEILYVQVELIKANVDWITLSCSLDRSQIAESYDAMNDCSSSHICSAPLQCGRMGGH